MKTNCKPRPETVLLAGYTRMDVYKAICAIDTFNWNQSPQGRAYWEQVTQNLWDILNSIPQDVP